MLRALKPGTALLVLTSCAVVSASCSRSEPPRQPDILLITVDTLRADFLGAYGSSLGATPRMDRLAERGVVFERAIAASSRTAPSHSSIMTSTWTRGHSMGPINGKATLVGGDTLAELAAQVGYRTAAFVGNVVLRRSSGLDRGFELYNDQLPDSELKREFVFEREADATTAAAIEWLGAHPDEPILLWVHYQDPHGPYTPPLEFADAFSVQPAPDEPALPINETDDDQGGIPAYQALPNLTRASEYQGRYAGEIAYADASIARLLAAFSARADRSGRDEIVLLTADHGESMGEDDRYFGHGFATAADLAHVPLILVGPGIEPSRRSEIVSHVDILPTLVELARLPAPANASGTSLIPLARGVGSLPSRLVYCDNGFELSAYAVDGFTTVRGIPLVKSVDLDLEVIRAAATEWETYRWKPGEAWQRTEPEMDHRERIERYMSHTTPIALAKRPLSKTERERLRVLGYTRD